MLEINNFVKLILNSLYDGVLIINKDGIVIYINPSYTRITKVQEKDILGELLTDIRPSSKLTELMKWGKSEIGTFRKENGSQYIANMVPIIKSQMIIGAISVINEVNDVYNLTKKLKSSNQIISNLSKHIIGNSRGEFFLKDIIAESKESLQNISFIKKIAYTNSNILIYGESGTGKKMYASAIHNETFTSSPFIKISVPSMNKNFFEENKFLFEIIDSGTILLDEISEMDYSLQKKLIELIEKKKNIRIISTAKKKLSELVKQGKFDENLYYKLSVLPMEIKPLRERKKDIPGLILFFLKGLNKSYNKNINITLATTSILSEYKWFGNAYELKNIIEYMYHTSSNNLIDIHNIPEIIHKESRTKLGIIPLSDKIKEFEKAYISSLILQFGNSLKSKKEIAKALNISLATLYNKLE